MTGVMLFLYFSRIVFLYKMSLFVSIRATDCLQRFVLKFTVSASRGRSTYVQYCMTL